MTAQVCMGLSKGSDLKFHLAYFACLGATLALTLSLATAQSAGTTQAKRNTTASSPASETPADQPLTTLSVQVKVVNVLATVRDKHGKIVNGLGKDDFTLTEDGRTQAIKYFARETDLPLTLGLLVDTSLSQRRVLGQEQSASQSFLAQMLREDKDKAFVIHFDREVELLQDLTSSREKLRDALDLLETPQLTRTSGRNWPGGGGGSGRGSGRRVAGTLLYDAVYLASNELMEKQHGRKALIVLSDGVDMGSMESLDEAIESAQRADTVVYSILFRDDDAYGNGGGFGRVGIGIPGMGGPGMGRGGMGGPGGAGVASRRNTPTARKFLSGFRKRLGGDCLKFRRRNPSIKSIRRFKRNCAISTASATPPIEQMLLSPDITRSRLPPNREIWWFRHEMDITETGDRALSQFGINCHPDWNSDCHPD